MKSPYTLRITTSLLAVLVITASMQFVDRRVAVGIWEITSRQPFLHEHFENIPNTLPQLVAIGTGAMWLAYYAVFRADRRSIQAQFILLAATSVPAAYLIKLFLQYAFGRTNIRVWLRTGGPVEFRWFNPMESGGFPSGHTVVFTAFFTAVWLYYPRYRPLVIAAFSALALALLLTSYHFVSDIISGACCGILTTLGIHHFQSKAHIPEP